MASRPSLYNEERNLLRMRAWEQRNQETNQDKELNPEDVPLFGEPYKTNKGDELSSRIQRMLGSYENVNNNPHPGSDGFAKEPSSSSTRVTFSRSSQGRPAHADRSAKPPFHNSAPYGSTQTHGGPPHGGGGHSSRHQRKPASSEQQSHSRPSSSFSSRASLCHSQGGQLSPPGPAHQRKGEAWPDLAECASLPPVLSALSPPAEPLSPLHSSDSEPQDTDDKDTPERHPLQGSPDHPPESPGSAMDVSPLEPHQSPRDVPLPQGNEGAPLPSQTFPLSLSSKAPNIVMTQKPTAYVRPMDGQDQVVNESPELKPSPEPYEPMPDLKSSKPSLSKLKMPSQSLETLSNEAQCVEDILREMTHSWPPLLTAIHTPSTAEPPRFSFPAKEAQKVSSAYPGQKHYGSPPTAPPSIGQQSSSSTVAAAHSSGVESASSSDSDSSSGSDSDSESSPEEPPQPLRSNSPLAKPEVPTATHRDWQLVHWIRSSQQSSSTEIQGEALASQSPNHKGLPPSQSPEAAKAEVANPAENFKPHLSPLQKEFSDHQAKPQQRKDGPQNAGSHHKPPSSTNSTSTYSSVGSHRKTVANKHPSKPPKAPRSSDPQAGLQVEPVAVTAPRDKDPSLTDRPKVKTKTVHSKTSGGGPKTDSKKGAKRTSSDKHKNETESGPRVTLVLDCKRETERARTPSPSPVQPNQPSPAPPAKVNSNSNSSSVRVDAAPKKGHKKPQRSLSPAADKPPAKRGHSSKESQAHWPSGALLVKIELSLLSRVPRPSKAGQQAPGSVKRPAPAPGQERGDNDTPTATPNKTSKKRSADKDSKAPPKKKPKLEKEVKSSSSSQTSIKSESPANTAEESERKKAKKAPAALQLPPTPQNSARNSGGHKRHSGDAQEPSAETGPGRETSGKPKKNTGKRTEHSKTGKQKEPKSNFAIPAPALPPSGALTTRPLVKFEDRQHPVEYYMKDAKKLKHKADATSDKVSKAFNYLEAAMSFVESGIAMEMDPQTPKSAYTMFAETVELIRFIQKLKNSTDPSAPATEKDFSVLCMRCHSILQMAMFRYKRETALRYSRTLTDHFKNSAKSAQAPSPCVSNTGTPSPMSDMPSPASTASSSGPGSNHSGGGLAAGASNTTVAIPQVIQQVASSYVNITSLFLSAQDIWDQADELVQRGSGMLAELDTVMGPLTLTSSMTSLVRYTRQGLHWLRLDSQEAQ